MDRRAGMVRCEDKEDYSHILGRKSRMTAAVSLDCSHQGLDSASSTSFVCFETY